MLVLLCYCKTLIIIISMNKGINLKIKRNLKRGDCSLLALQTGFSGTYVSDCLKGNANNEAVIKAAQVLISNRLRMQKIILSK